MWTRGALIPRDTPCLHDTSETQLTGLARGGSQPLLLPPGGAGGCYAMDPSDPRTWRRPVRWT